MIDASRRLCSASCCAQRLLRRPGLPPLQEVAALLSHVRRQGDEARHAVLMAPGLVDALCGFYSQVSITRVQARRDIEMPPAAGTPRQPSPGSDHITALLLHLTPRPRRFFLHTRIHR